MKIYRKAMTGVILSLGGMALLTGCYIFHSENSVKAYPAEVEVSPELRQFAWDSLPCYDMGKMKEYTLGDYRILRSILCGPTGRATNFQHYLLMDKEHTRKLYFMSLTDETKNIWMERDTLFVNLLEYDEEAYDNGVYLDQDTCPYTLLRLRLNPGTFSFDTLKTRTLMMEQSEAWSALCPAE